jgi:monovalent cation/proton antiporter MnhG/PhaG subunit
MNALLVVLLLLYLLGLFFNLAAVLGIIRMPDLYCRLHSSSKNTTLGSLLIILGLSLRQIQIGNLPATLKILFIGLLLLIVTPIGSHALARAAYKFGTPLWEGTIVDQYPEVPGEGWDGSD